MKPCVAVAYVTVTK